MNILVTGGSGFIGTRLVSLLASAGHDVKIYDKNPSQEHPALVIQKDVRDLDTLSKACDGQDVIYHLAAEHRDDVTPISLYEEVNVGGAKNLVQAAIAAGVNKIIFTSSVAVYPLNAGTPDENGTIAPFNPYGVSKYEAEKILCEWQKEDPDRHLTIVRPCVVFGEENRGNVHNLLEQISSGRFVMVGRGQNCKSMAYVGNITEFFMECLNIKGLEVFNYADKPDLNTRELVQVIGEAIGKDVNSGRSIPYPIGLLGGYAFDALSFILRRKFSVSSIRIKKFCAETTVSAQKVIDHGFKAPYSLREGLKRTIEHEFLNQNSGSEK